MKSNLDPDDEMSNTVGVGHVCLIWRIPNTEEELNEEK